jgi:hypothetical protein
MQMPQPWERQRRWHMWAALLTGMATGYLALIAFVFASR